MRECRSVMAQKRRVFAITYDAQHEDMSAGQREPPQEWRKSSHDDHATFLQLVGLGSFAVEMLGITVAYTRRLRSAAIPTRLTARYESTRVIPCMLNPDDTNASERSDVVCRTGDTRVHSLNVFDFRDDSSTLCAGSGKHDLLLHVPVVLLLIVGHGVASVFPVDPFVYRIDGLYCHCPAGCRLRNPRHCVALELKKPPCAVPGYISARLARSPCGLGACRNLFI